MPTPASTRIVSEETIKWTNGSLFNGFILVEMSTLPTGLTYATLAGYPLVRVPIFVKVPIIDGVIASDVRIWQNASLSPPGNSVLSTTSYTLYWYDSTGTARNGSSVAYFTSEEYTVAPPTLTSP